MTIGNSRILVCPFCGEEKEIMSLLSGNNIGVQIWSDNKQFARMLPEISYIQKCPCCGKYYIIGRQAIKRAEKSCSRERGLLTFAEMKEAFSQFSEEGFINESEESHVRMMLHHAFNDYYFRNGDNIKIDIDDWILFRKNCIWLIDNFISDNILKAELYREICEFEKAKELLESVEIYDVFIKRFAILIQEKISKNDCRVFRIK